MRTAARILAAVQGALGAGVRDAAGPAGQELKLAGIRTIEAANPFIREVYLPAHNARFAAPQAQQGSAFMPIPGIDLDEILCVEEERQVGTSYQHAQTADPGEPVAAAFHQGLGQGPRLSDGSHAVFHGPPMHRTLR